MDNKVDTIAARIGGKDIQFRLGRSSFFHIQSLEMLLGKSLFATFRDIADGVWSTTKFGLILSAAKSGGHPGRGDAFIEKVLATNPPGNYAGLVAKVIEAHLFGIAAEEATFTDEPVAA